ncbi:MAG: LysR family transcriptional regulator [Colwellia sp.]|nr:LysR family transcriptional regulator [Colwellia sp.]
MNQSLPALNAVRVFEAAARLQNFTKAANEIHITQGSVSKQIKLLEQQLGCQLFIRTGPILKLSDAGKKFQAITEESLSIIRRGTARLRNSSTNTPLTISLLPSFAHNWFLPNLASFEQKHPEVSLRLAPSYHPVDLDVDSDIDLAIRLGRGDWPNLHSLQVTEDELIPVCVPNIASQLNNIRDIKDQRLIVDSSPYDEWHRWRAKAGLNYTDKNCLYLDDVNLQLAAAIEGRGICLSRKSFVMNHLAQGNLVQAFELSIYSKFNFYLVCPTNRLDEQKTSIFYQWIKEVR